MILVEIKLYSEVFRDLSNQSEWMMYDRWEDFRKCRIQISACASKERQRCLLIRVVPAFIQGLELNRENAKNLLSKEWKPGHRGKFKATAMIASDNKENSL